MRELLQKAVSEIEKLPAEEQDEVALRILMELDDEREWASRFAATTGDQWNNIVRLAREDINSGKTIPLQDILPSESDKS